MFDGNATDLGFSALDGDDTVLFKDLDGSTTGVGGRGNFVVKPLPFHLTEQCEEIDNWKMAICPHQYGQVSARRSCLYILVSISYQKCCTKMKQICISGSNQF